MAEQEAVPEDFVIRSTRTFNAYIQMKWPYRLMKLAMKLMRLSQLRYMSPEVTYSTGWGRLPVRTGIKNINIFYSKKRSL
jgi:hypothetical protein